jgi:hypothetical protein
MIPATLMRVLRRALLLVMALSALAPAVAQETITYTYDARGRLINADHGTTGPNAGVSSAYTYDNADNRTQVVVNVGGGVTLTLSPTTLPNGTVGTSYSTQISASGGTSPYTYSKTSGTLPTGLTLSSAGLLSGTPTAAGPYTFTVTATDSASQTGSRSYNPTINSSGGTLTLSPATLPNGTVGTSYSAQISASGGTSPYTYSKTSGTLPTGLTLSSGGLLSGTPTTAGTYTFTVTATDSASHTGSLSYSPTISTNATACSGVSFAVNDVTVVEGDPLVFTVTKSGASSSNCSVSYATADGTATAPDYYTAVSGTLTFSSNQTTQTVTVQTVNLGRLNLTKNMYLNLSNATSAGSISDSQGIGSIQASGGDPNPCPLC